MCNAYDASAWKPAGTVSFALQVCTYVLDISIIERPSSPWEYGTFRSCVPAALSSFEALRSSGRDSASLVRLLFPLFPSPLPNLFLPTPRWRPLFFLLIISIPRVYLYVSPLSSSDINCRGNNRLAGDRSPKEEDRKLRYLHEVWLEFCPPTKSPAVSYWLFLFSCGTRLPELSTS